ncbi:hypothetical protein V492_01686 [Pseudogymnoascus sp. VKM F-4246]|nr:hypothetical protein V492_01686 [Pseudogymnoascus sp. VKM F-4246]
MAQTSSSSAQHHVTLIGLGTIGISFAALHIKHTNAIVSVYDTRPDLEEYISSVLPGYIDSEDAALSLTQLRLAGRLNICSSLEEACKNATIVQEQGPENPSFKKSIWAQVEKLVSDTTHLWSSTSGIPASVQVQDMSDQTRLLVVHPFNPPHVMPLLEIVPSPTTKSTEADFAKQYFTDMASGHQPIVLKKEITGFVGNRLAFALLREACYLVDQDIISAQDLDLLVESSIGPRWAVQGPFKSYNMGGGAAGLGSFLKHLSGTVQGVWDSSVPLNFSNPSGEWGSDDWEGKVVAQVAEAYGSPNPAQYTARDAALQGVIEVQKKMRDDQV